MTMAWILQAVGGGESIGVYIRDTKGGNKNICTSMIISTLVVGLMMFSVLLLSGLWFLSQFWRATSQTGSLIFSKS